MLVIQPLPSDGEPLLALTGNLTIYDVQEACAALRGFLEASPRLRLHLAGVEELDSAGIQLLAWLKREAALRGGDLQLESHSPAVLEVMDLLRVTSLFGDPILLSPAQG